MIAYLPKEAYGELDIYFILVYTNGTEMRNMNNNGLITRLELIQEAHGWSNREVAERLGISRVFWLKVRQGQRSPGPKFLRGVLSAFPELADAALAFLEDSE